MPFQFFISKVRFTKGTLLKYFSTTNESKRSQKKSLLTERLFTSSRKRCVRDGGDFRRNFLKWHRSKTIYNTLYKYTRWEYFFPKNEAMLRALDDENSLICVQSQLRRRGIRNNKKNRSNEETLSFRRITPVLPLQDGMFPRVLSCRLFST